MVNNLSLRFSLATGIIFMGVLGVIMAWYVDTTYRKIALDNQRLAIEEIMRLRVDDLITDAIKYSRDLGQSAQNNKAFRNNLRERKANDLQPYLEQQFHQYFVTAGVLNLTALLAHDPDLRIVSKAVSKEVVTLGRGGTACASLHLQAQARKGVDRYKVISKLCLNEGFPNLHVLIPIGGLKLVGYLEIITDPVYTLSAIEKNLGMPLRILFVDRSQAYVSDNWPSDSANYKGLIAQFSPKASSGEASMVLEVIRDVHDYELLLSKTRNGLMITVVALTFLFASLMLLFVKKTTLDPLREIGKFLRKIKQDSNQLGELISVSGNEEIKEFAERFNEMTTELKSLYDELQKTNVDLTSQIKDRESAEIQLKLSRDHLEELVEKRTADLAIARDSALRASQSKSYFLANMSHELRTPLNAIIGYTEMMLEDAKEIGSEFEDDLYKVHTSANHLLVLIKDILDLTKIEAGKIELDLEWFKIQDMIEEVSLAIHPLISENENQFSAEYGEDIGSMFADTLKVRQSLLNLLSNAAKFTHGGKVCLRVTRFEENDIDKVLFTVYDTGIGLSNEETSKIFEAFTQADTSTTRKYGGTGLGLAISRNFCQLMGGDLFVTSRKGQGSSFSFVLPAEVKPLESPMYLGGEFGNMESSRISPALAKQKAERRSYVSTILVLHKDEYIANHLVSYLNIKAYNSEFATNIDNCISLIEGQRVDVIVVDIDIAIEHDWKILNELTSFANAKDASIILLGSQEQAARGMALGVADVLSKPVDKALLYASVNNCVRDRGFGRRAGAV